MPKVIDLQLVQEAQAGHREAFSTLSELARDKVHVFIYRLTLDLHLTEDLTQDTLLELVQSKSRLTFTHVHFFWAWLHRTALGKVQHHYRVQGNRRIDAQTVLDDERLKLTASPDHTGIHRMMKEEVRQSVFDAMAALSLAYRSILTLRCFEQKTYPEIGAITGQTELQARVQFFRAKQSLKKQLLRKGLGREHFLGALSLFGTLTAGSAQKTSAAVTVSEASLSVGAATAGLALVTSKMGIVTAVLLLLASALGSLQLVHQWRQNRSLNDRTLQGAYRLFANPQRVLDAFDADQSGWEAYNRQQLKVTLQPVGIEATLTRPSANETHMLELPEQHWVHVAFAGPIVDGPGADILIDARRYGQKPRVFISDGDTQELEVSRTSALTTAGGFDYSGYDLQEVVIPFVPRAIRLEGSGNATEQNSLVLWIIKARIESAP